MPGSLVAIRVDYNRSGTAFDPPGPETAVGKVRTDVRRWKQGHRLGDPPEWNSTTYDPQMMNFPSRPMMHTVSEFQAVRLNYNYRAAVLPEVNHRTVFVPKPNKMQVDKKLFLSTEEKAKLVERCPGTATLLSAFESRNHTLPGIEREEGWNVSTLPDGERTNIFKLRSYDDYRAANKALWTSQHEASYISPVQRQEAVSQAVREAKLEQREAERRRLERLHHYTQREREQGGKVVYKMSNIDTWWTRPPPSPTQPSLSPPSQPSPR